MMDLDFDGGPRRCLGCGSHVPTGFARVHGDEENRVHRCRACDSYTNIVAGSAAGLEENIDDHRRQIADKQYCEPISIDGGLAADRGIGDE